MSVYPGNLLTVTAASVNAVPASTRTWAWLRNNTAIPAQTSTTYRITEADIGTVLAAQQTETNFVGATSVSSAQVGPIQTFSPSLLFAAGEQGVWFDPSDVANLDWRRNLLTWSEQFDNAAWVKGEATVAQVSGAEWRVTPNTNSAPHFITQSAIIGGAMTVSVDLKAGGYNFVLVETRTTSGSFRYSAINLVTGLTSAISGGVTVSSTPLADSWWRLTMTWDAETGTSSRNTAIFPSTSMTIGGATFAGDGTSGILVRYPQIETGSVATDYQRITDLNTEVIARFPTATLYQDSAGTTPVTTPGQSVGLMLDKSKGLVLGSELRGGGSASTIGTPSIPTSYNVTTGVGRVRRDDALNAGSVEILTPSTGFYFIDVEVPASSTGSIRLRTDNAIGGAIDNTPSAIAPGSRVRFRVRIVSSGVQKTAFYVSCTANAETSDFTVHSVKELPGNHAVQATTANRPIYGVHPFGGRRNLLVRTEEFDNAAWTKTRSSISANAVVAPDGTTTADKLVEDTTSTSSHNTTSAVLTLASASTTTLSLYVKAAERTWCRIADGGVTSGGAFVNLSTGQFGTIEAGVTASSIQSVGNGWYRVSVTGVLAGTSSQVLVQIATGNGTTSYTGDGTSGILIWGAQLETGSTATNYQRVTDQYNVTEAGVPSVSYLFFNANNFSMATPSIDFATATSDGQARRNLLTFPTAFDDSVWAKTATTVTANASLAPDGTTTADTLTEDTATSTHLVRSAVVSLPGSSTATFSVYAKPNGRTWLQLANASYGNTVYFDLSTGAVGNTSFASGSAVAVGNGWYRCSITFGTNAGNQQFDFRLASSNGVNSYAGNGTSGVLLWGAQLEIGTTASAFQNIGTDKMSVFAGVRKLSDAGFQSIAELSPTADANVGSFCVGSSTLNGDVSRRTWATVMGGTNSGILGGAFVYAAPSTNVLSALYDIAQSTSATENILRVGGVQQALALSPGNAGTGNFNAYPLFIGARNGAGNFFSGHLYSLIVRGAQSNSIFTTAPEAWVAGKTGVVIA